MIQTVEPTHKIEIGIKDGKLCGINWGTYIEGDPLSCFELTPHGKSRKKKELIAVLKNAIKIVKQVKV